MEIKITWLKGAKKVSLLARIRHKFGAGQGLKNFSFPKTPKPFFKTPGPLIF
jgi:hypothetical protein